MSPIAGRVTQLGRDRVQESRYGLKESGIQETRSSESGLGANEGTGEDRSPGVCL